MLRCSRSTLCGCLTLSFRLFESNNLKFEGEDFLSSCLAVMEQFAVSAEDLVLKLESKVFELSKGNQAFAVSMRHIEAVRQQLEHERKQETLGSQNKFQKLQQQRAVRSAGAVSRMKPATMPGPQPRAATDVSPPSQRRRTEPLPLDIAFDPAFTAAEFLGTQDRFCLLRCLAILRDFFEQSMHRNLRASASPSAYARVAVSRTHCMAGKIGLFVDSKLPLSKLPRGHSPAMTTQVLNIAARCMKRQLLSTGIMLRLTLDMAARLPSAPSSGCCSRRDAAIFIAQRIYGGRGHNHTFPALRSQMARHFSTRPGCELMAHLRAAAVHVLSSVHGGFILRDGAYVAEWSSIWDAAAGGDAHLLEVRATVYSIMYSSFVTS